MAGRMWFGTRENMMWVKCPAIEADMGRGKWSATGGYLNGGAYVRSSSNSHARFGFSWNLATSADVYDVLDYAHGVYGDGLIYFIDPFAAPHNVLPLWWSVPRLQADDAPPLTKNRRPSTVATAANSWHYPTSSAVFTFDENSVFDSIWVPIPEDHTLHFGVHGSATGTAEITVTPDGGSLTAIDMLDVDSSQLTSNFWAGPGGVTISAQGDGQLTLAGMVAQVHPSSLPAPTGRFHSGRGHSGCRFEAPPSVNGYSAALDKIAASATLVETGGWED